MTHPLLKCIRQLVKEGGGSEHAANFCAEIARSALIRSSHVVRAWSVSLAVGFCTYAARLIESIGVRGTYSMALPGKGRTIHKLLAIAAPYTFYEFLRRERQVSESDIRHALEKALGTVRVLEPELISGYSETDISNIITRAQKLLLNFAYGIQQIAKELKIDLTRCHIIIEQQLIDFDLHIVGTPDLIVECYEGDKGRAIVVEWKTYEGRSTPTRWEKVQVYVYALLEAARLGYGKEVGIPSLPHKVNFKKLVEAIANENPESVAVYPVIIRTQGLYSDHPALPKSARKPHTVKSLKTLLRNIIIAAAHLSLLVTDYVSLSGYDANSIKQLCEIKINTESGRTYRGSALRWTPKELTLRGNPVSRQRYPCNVCSKIFKLVYEACPHFFGKGPEKDVLDKFIWEYRFRIYSIHERGLLTLKALHDLGRHVFMEAVEKGRTIKYNLLTVTYTTSNNNINQSRPILECRSRNSYDNLRVDVFDEARLLFSIFDDYEADYRGDIAIELIRNIRDHERRWLRSSNDNIPRIWTPRRGNPVFIAFSDNASTPTLSISLFGRVADVRINGTMVILRVEPISNALKFPFVLASMYYKYRPEIFRRVLVMEVNMDLTHIELNALYELQLVLRKEFNQLKAKLESDLGLASNDAESCIEMLQQLISRSCRNVFELIIGSLVIERYLRGRST